MRNNLRSHSGSFAPEDRFQQMARYAYEFQYLRFSTVPDPWRFFLGSTWFEEEFLRSGIISRDPARELFAAVGRVCDLYEVDSSRFIGAEKSASEERIDIREGSAERESSATGERPATGESSVTHENSVARQNSVTLEKLWLSQRFRRLDAGLARLVSVAAEEKREVELGQLAGLSSCCWSTGHAHRTG